MAAEITVAKEKGVSALNATGKPMSHARQYNAVMNAKIEPSGGKTRISLGEGQSVTFNVHYVNREQGYVEGLLNLKRGSGRNRFHFGGRSGMSFEDALLEVKRDVTRNL